MKNIHLGHGALSVLSIEAFGGQVTVISHCATIVGLKRACWNLIPSFYKGPDLSKRTFFFNTRLLLYL